MRSEPRGIILDVESLFSKWGFRDGDLLKEWWWDAMGEEPPFEHHDILYALVVAYLVPAVTQAGIQVDVYRIYTNHNPARTESVNGVEINRSYKTDDISVPSVEVKVTKEQILDLVNKLVIKEN